MLFPTRLAAMLAGAVPLAAALLLSACGGGGHHGAAAGAHSHDDGPVVTAITPSSAEAGGAAFTLVVDGAGFANGAVVRWNGGDRPTTFNTDTQLQAEIAASDIAAPGSANVTVLNPPGAEPEGESGAVTFLITSASGGGTVTSTTEFAIITPTTGDQRRPSVAALATVGHNSSVACIYYEDNSADHQHFRVCAVDRRGNTSGQGLGVEIAHHTEGVNYIGIAAAPVTSEYFAGGRYHPNVTTPEPHPRSLYLHSFGDDSGNENAVRCLPTETLGATLTDIDIAIDPSGGTRFMIFRVSAVSGTDPGTPTEGLNGVFFTGPSSVSPSAAFLLSSAPFTHQRSCRIAFDGTSYLVVWEEDGVIRGRRFDASCAPLGDDITISATTGGLVPRVAAGPAGGFLVVWQQSGITARAVGADGTPAASTFSVSTTPGIEAPALAGSPSGEWLVTWTGSDGSGSGIFARRLDASLAPVDAEAGVNTVTAGAQLESSVAWAQAAQAWIVVWAGPDVSGLGLRGRFVP